MPQNLTGQFAVVFTSYGVLGWLGGLLITIFISLPLLYILANNAPRSSRDEVLAIGLAIAWEFAGECAEVALVDRAPEVVGIGTALAATLQPVRRRAACPRTPTPSVSIVIPAASPAPALEASAADLARLDYPDYEVVLCAAKTDTEALELIERVARLDPRFRTCQTKHRDGVNPKSVLLAAAVGAARHDLLLAVFCNAPLTHRAPAVRRCCRPGPRP